MLITTWNGSGLNPPIKRYRMAEWIKKQDPSMCYLLHTHRLNVKDGKKYSMKTETKSCIAILRSDKIDIKTRTIMINRVNQARYYNI